MQPSTSSSDLQSHTKPKSPQTETLKLSELRQRLLADPVLFLRYLYPKQQFKWFHAAWLEQVSRNKTTLTLAPRGHAKTTVITTAEIVRRLLKNRERRILLVSKTFDQARAIYSQVATLMRNFIPTTQVWGDEVATIRGTELWMRGRKEMRKEASLTAMGVLGPLTMRHFDEIFMDDSVDFENTRKKDRRKTFADWVGMTLLPTLEPGGRLHWIGTRYHAEDYYGSNLLNRKTWPDLVTNEGTHRAIDDKGLALWPQRYSLDVLNKIRANQGPAIFSAQYQNDVTLMQGSIFRREWFKYYDKVPEGAAVYLGVDPAIGQKEQSDYTAIAAVAVDNGKYYVIECTAEHWTFEEQIRMIRWMQGKHHAVLVGIEDVAYQRALVETCERLGVPVMRVPRRVDKVARAYGIQGLFEQGDVLMPQNQSCQDLESEMLAFPEVDHDDRFDALETAISVARAGSQAGIEWV